MGILICEAGNAGRLRGGASVGDTVSFLVPPQEIKKAATTMISKPCLSCIDNDNEFFRCQISDFEKKFISLYTGKLFWPVGDIGT